MNNESLTLSGATSSAKDAIAEAAAQVGEKASELGRQAAATIDDQRSAAAAGMEKAASGLRENAAKLPGGERVANLAYAAADKLSCTGDYVRSSDVGKMVTDFEVMVKNNPGRSLIAAAVAGFIVARAFRGNES